MGDLIKKETPKIVAAIAEHDNDIYDIFGYQEISGHLTFDVKLGDNFQREARFVSYGQKTDTPSSVTYSTVVSRDLVRIRLYNVGSKKY